MIDYVLKSAASRVTLEIFDAQKKLVSKFSSADTHVEKHSSLPIAERWFLKPELLQTTPGMHRFVWNLTWGDSGEPPVDEESESRIPTGPKVVPAIYQVRLTVDGQTQSQSIKILMDPRSPATSEILQQQLQLGQRIFVEAMEARRVLAEIGGVKKKLAEAEQKVGENNQELKSAVADAQKEIAKILTKKEPNQRQPGGLQGGYVELTSALRVVEGGDRAVPSQATAVYKESSSKVTEGIADWARFKQMKLPPLNEKLREASLTPIAISENEEEVQFLNSN
jgi:hypothetical protein